MFNGSLLLRIVVTLLLVTGASLLGWELWHDYMRSPCTRDGRVRAEIVDIAPEISGTVVELRVRDNQLVHKGDLLFTIDPERYRLALAQAEATVARQKHEMELAQSQAARRAQIRSGYVSAEEREKYAASAAVAAAAYQEAIVQRDIARLNMARTEVRAPVNGYVTNLNLRVGDYATSGRAAVAMIDSDSFWVSGYFEETKIPAIHAGDMAVIRLMGIGEPLAGHVESISRGIADRNDNDGAKLLPDVNPTFSWVRLAQRIPVRIHLDSVPNDILLSAGMTCTVIVQPGKDETVAGARQGIASS